MKKMKKILTMLLFTMLFCFSTSGVAMAGTDMGTIGSDGKNSTIVEAVEPGSEKYLIFKTSSTQTEYKFIFENVHVKVTSFDLELCLNGGANTVIYTHTFSVKEAKVTELITLVPDTEYYICVHNSSSSDTSVVPEFKITAADPNSDILTLNQSSLLMKKGKKAALKADYSTDNAGKELTWKSSNKKVATVNSQGKVTAVSAGTATITCTSKADENLKAACKVTVVTEAKSVTLSKKKVTVEEGSTVSLNTSVKPSGAKNQPILWKSSNESVATVAEDGTVTGVKEGTANISATVQYRSEKSVGAICKVTVKEAAAKDTSDVAITLGQGEDNITMTYQYAAGICYSAVGKYTLKVGNYKGNLDITFKLTSGSDVQTVSVVPNSTYYLNYTYTFDADQGTRTMIPQTTYQMNPITHVMEAKTTYTYSTIPAVPTESDLSVTVSGKTCKYTTSSAGAYKKGTLSYEKQ